MANFFIDFDSDHIPWRREGNCQNWNANLSRYNMEGDPFREEFLSESATPAFFRPHKFSVDWELVGLWKCWAKTRRHNWRMLRQFEEVRVTLKKGAVDDAIERRLTEEKFLAALR